MLNTKKLAALAILGALVFNPAYAEEKSAALVNGVSIPQSRVDAAVQAEVLQGQADTPELRKYIRERMIKIELMTQEAKKLNLDKSPEVLQELEVARQTVLINAYLADYMKKNPIGEELLKQEYDTIKTKWDGREYNVRHIMVATEDEAKGIVAQLDKKAKFEKLAAKSKDAGSVAQGGSLGWQGGSLGWKIPGDVVPVFVPALQSLKKGEYTRQPVQTPYGWHVIKLDDERVSPMPAFENVKQNLLQRMQNQAKQKAISDLEAKAKVE